MTQQPGFGEPGARGNDQPSYAGPGTPAQPAPSNPFSAPAPGSAPTAAPAYPPSGYGQQPQYGQPQYGQPGFPPGERKTSGLAVASFILGLLSIALISIILGIIALVQIPKRGQKGKVFAWLGIVLSVLWIVGGIVAGAALYQWAKNQQVERDPAGNISAAKDVDPSDLRVGDCVQEVKEGQQGVTAVPCTGAHSAKVFATFDLPAGDYPGDAAVSSQSEKGCSDRMADATGKEYWYFSPNQLQWTLDDHTVVCLANDAG